MNMGRQSALLLLVVLIQVLGPSRLDAQAALSGAVRDTGGSILPGVTVTATSPALAEPSRSVTDHAGRYSLGDLPAGTYTIIFTLPGFVETTRSDIVLPAAADSPLDVVMRIGPLAETITISRGSRQGALLNPQDRPTCTIRVIPVDPSIDERMIKEPEATEDYAIRIVPPPCQASHPAQNR
jgi:hypothetical protein